MDPSRFAKQTEILIPAVVRMISGCHSEQTSADLTNVKAAAGKLPNPAGRSGGACTSALLEVLYRHHKEEQYRRVHQRASTSQSQSSSPSELLVPRKNTFQRILLELRESLSNRGFDQIPQLSSSRPLELEETPFSLRGNGGHGADGTCRALLVGINYIGQNGQLVSILKSGKNLLYF